MPGLLSLANNSTALNPLFSQRSVINVWYPQSEWSYRYIDHMILGDNAITPIGSAFGSAWDATKTFRQVVDSKGWVNDTTGSGQSWGLGIRLPKSSDFAGPYVITWDGDGKVIWFNPPTWTEESTSIVRTGNANGTTTLSGFSDVTGLSIGFPVSGAGVSGGTTIVSIDYGAKTIVVSAAVTTGAGVIFTFTNNTYTRNANGQWTNTTGGKGYVVASNSLHTSVSNIQAIHIVSTGIGGAISVSSMSWSSGVVTVTTASPHGRPLGYTLALTFFGATPSSVNGTYDCTVTGASTYTFELADDPGSITGSLTYIAFVTNVRVYRLEDETDFMPTSKGGNGNIFRTAYKQMMVNLRPSVIRLLNDIDGNNSVVYRFENRSKPTHAGGQLSATVGPAYNATSGTYQVTVDAVSTPFPGNRNLTPADMVHGEICSTRVTNAIPSGGKTISGITKANPGVVTATAHGYSNGDQVWFAMPYPSNQAGSMKELDRVACIVANATTDTFEIQDLDSVNIDTTSFTTFTSGTVYRYTSLDVGGRGAYPIVQGSKDNGNPSFIASVNGMGSGYRTFYFDKNQACRRTAGSGANWVQGAWLQRLDQAWGDIPLEHCSALVAEINLLAQSQGVNQPIHLWVTLPPTMLLDCDPDYDTTSEYPINAINALFDGDPDNGYRGLKTTNARLIVEYSNEPWNFGSFAANYMNWLGYIRGTINTANFESIQALRSTRMARDIRANSPWSSRVFLTLGMQGILGWGAQNQYVALGNLVSSSNIIFTDPWNNWGSATPVSFHDAINPATYIQPSISYLNLRYGPGTFTDDSALYSGTDNSASITATFTAGNAIISATNSFRAGEYVQFTTTVGNIAANTNYRVSATNLSGSQFQLTTTGFSPITPDTNGSASTPAGGNYTGAADPTQAIENFITNIETQGTTGGSQTFAHYCLQSDPGGGLLGQFNDAMALLNKRVIQYEGGNDWNTKAGLTIESHLITANDSTFLLDVTVSDRWAQAQEQFFDNIKNLSNHGPAALYLYLKNATDDLRWGYAARDFEEADINNTPMWLRIGARNALLSI